MRESHSGDGRVSACEIYDLTPKEPLARLHAPEVYLLQSPGDGDVIVVVLAVVDYVASVAIVLRELLNSKLQRLLVQPGELCVVSDGFVSFFFASRALCLQLLLLLVISAVAIQASCTDLAIFSYF